MVELLWTSIVILLAPRAFSFEAAFQGECREDSPCHQLCFDLHDGTFECGCRDGFRLLDNGYSCAEHPGGWEDAETTAFIPTNFSFNDTFFPDDASIFFGEDEGAELWPALSTGEKKREPRRGGPEEDDSLAPDYNGTEYDRGVDLELAYSARRKEYRRRTDGEDKDWTLPLALPWDAPTDEVCDECGNSGGICVSTVNPPLCRCPYGRTGSKCQAGLKVKVPYFQGLYSYLTLPLRATEKTMQVTLEFRSERPDGLLLLAFQNSSRGDFSFLALKDGFVTFRYRCEGREGVLRSYQPAVLHSWNTVALYRDRQDVWMQLNSGKQVHHRLSVLSFKMRLEPELYVGGFFSNNVFNAFGGLEFPGFRGCVRYLEVNSFVYKFSQREVIRGHGVEECPLDGCAKMSCLNGGMCVSHRDRSFCYCPPQVTGAYCETVKKIVVPAFQGRSFIQYSPLDWSVLSFLELELVLKPEDPDGLVLYSGSGNRSGDFILLTLIKGFLEFSYSLGSGIGIARSWQPLALHVWHRVTVSRTGRYVSLTVDDQSPSEGFSPGAFTQLYLPLSLFLGGLPTFWRPPPSFHSRDHPSPSYLQNFVGCVQKLSINSRAVRLLEDAVSAENVTGCQHPCEKSPCYNGGQCIANLDFYMCHCGLGHAGPNCEKSVTEVISSPMFSGTSYLHYTDEEVVRRLEGSRTEVELEFRSFAPHGVILWTGSPEVADFLLVELRDGHVALRYNLGSGEIRALVAGPRLDDGQWHSLILSRSDQESTLKIDNRPAVSCRAPGGLRQLNTHNGLYLGGKEELAPHYGYTGLVGCLANVTLALDYRLRLLTQAAEGVNIQPCV